ncbi:hypothetical protein [Catenulispora subtropica]|uniref:Uncharacterized protein n=1 Tax=Catenulispora subtropica TaxID=450798 RepID=A0ABN2T2A4_9ACTN
MNYFDLIKDDPALATAPPSDLPAQTDGPYAEAKELLAGELVIGCACAAKAAAAAEKAKAQRSAAAQ